MKTVVLLAVMALANPTATLESLKYGVKPGTKLTYTSNSVTAFDGAGQTFESTMKQTIVIEAEAVVDGWTRVKTTVQEHQANMGMEMGMEMPNPTGLVTTVLVSPTRKQKDLQVVSNGKMSTDHVDQLKARTMSDLQSGFEGLTLPEGDISVGTTWSLEHDPAGVGFSGMPATTNGKLKTTYKVLEITGSGADRAFVIEGKTAGAFVLSIEAPGGGAFDMDVKADGTTKFTVRTSDGALVKAEGMSLQDMSSPFGAFKSSTTTRLELVKN